MPKFFVNQEQINDYSIFIRGKDAFHIANVLRYKINDKILISNGQGLDFYCIIKDINNDYIEASILDKYENESEPKCDIVLFQALVKSDKMDLIIQKAVEIGVTKIYPVFTERTIIKISDKKVLSKVERWNKISASASKQCRRGIVPEIVPPILYKEAIDLSRNIDNVIIPYENEYSLGIKQYLSEKKSGSFGVFIGPEGGFTEKEIDYASKCGISSLTLGKRILRAETAALVTISIILYEMGEM